MLILGNKVWIGGQSKYAQYIYSNYPFVCIKSEKVDIVNLDDRMQPVLDALNRISIANFCNLTITSGLDGKHGEKSYHPVGRAVDISFKSGYTGISISGWAGGGSIFESLKKILNPYSDRKNFDVVLEEDHVHIEYDPTINGVKNENKTSGKIVKKDTVKERVIKYIHNDPTITNVSDLISKNPLFKDVKLDELAKYDGGTGTSNEERTNSGWWSPVLKDDEQVKWPELYIGSVLYVKSVALVRDSLAIEGTNQVKDFQSWGQYQTKTQIELNHLKTYIPTYKWASNGNYNIENTIKGVNSFFRIWIYSKILDSIQDVTDFCKVVVTNTNMSNTDSFSIELSYIDNEDFEKSNDYYIENKISRCSSFQKDKMSFFMRTLSENDIVFISFEQLQCEENRKSFVVDKSMLFDQYYDFMGLIQSVSQTTSPSGQSGVSIEGLSFSKMFQEDEAVFRPISAIEDSFFGNIILGDRGKRGWIQRFFADSEYHSLFTSNLRTIERTLKFYLNLVSNVGLLPVDSKGNENVELFSSWGDNRTKLFDIKVDKEGHVDEVEQSFAKGLYQVIKLQVQPELASRHLSDGSICNPEGTVMNLLQGTCVHPLVEMIMDTYKNTFDIVCRVPPFNKKSIVEWLDTIQSLDRFGNNSFGNIEIEDVFSENLIWENNFYTWFELHPQGTMISADSMISLCYLPTLFFPEYINIWGSRKLSVVSPYSVVGSEEQENYDEIGQAVQDLCWMVESHFYLPFTRRGTIVLSSPDRRIKKGQWIRYKKTGEIFYVDGVQQSVSVSTGSVRRQTILQVSRGLVEKYVKSKDGYFGIFDLNKLSSQLQDFYKDKENRKKTTTISLSPIVNKELFNFFLSRKQFSK